MVLTCHWFNLLLLKDDVVKLADFGSCRSVYSKQPYTEYISTRWWVVLPCFIGHTWLKTKLTIAGRWFNSKSNNIPYKSQKENITLIVTDKAIHIKILGFFEYITTIVSCKWHKINQLCQESSCKQNLSVSLVY